jgi:hypothetical protein
MIEKILITIIILIINRLQVKIIDKKLFYKINFSFSLFTTKYIFLKNKKKKKFN